MTWSIPTLETPRLVLRPLEPAHADALLAVYDSPEATRYLDITPLEIPEEALALIEFWNEVQDRRGGARWGIFLRDGNELVGTCGFNSLSFNEYKGELSYDLAPPYWGLGLVPEAARAVLSHGFGELRLHRVQACVVPEGAQSARVLEKLGFRLEGVLRGAGYWKGRFWDKVCYSLLRDEWTSGLVSRPGQAQALAQSGPDRRPVAIGDAVHH